MDLFDRIIMEAELSTEERNELKASQFGLPEERKFPLTDAKHVRSAISYFHTCPEDKKAQLAKRIKSEEVFLEQELSGYAEYKQKVPYRLIPFIW